MSDSQHEIAALFVESGGRYFGMPNVDPWDVARDARQYDRDLPVVAHPPCFLWVNLAAVNWVRYKRERPAWYPGGTDGGCFASALAAVRRCGGVLEHPAGSWAWQEFGLKRPDSIGWQVDSVLSPSGHSYVCEVWQSAYGHKARKRTWLYYAGNNRPADLRWDRPTGSHQVGWFDRIKPTLSKTEASRTPIDFAAALIALAANAAPPPRTNKGEHPVRGANRISMARTLGPARDHRHARTHRRTHGRVRVPRPPTRCLEGEAVIKLRDVARALGMGDVGCGDNSCLWGSTGGMGTNGGCRCYGSRGGQSERIGMLQFQRVARHLLDVYNVLESGKEKP